MMNTLLFVTLCVVVLQNGHGQFTGLKEVLVKGPATIPKGEKKTFRVGVRTTLNKASQFSYDWVALDGATKLDEGVRSKDVPNKKAGALHIDGFKFELECTDDCKIKGSKGASGKKCVDLIVEAENISKQKKPSEVKKVCCSEKSNNGGEPHFSTFHGEHFDFHGVCDLVLTQSSTFASSKGLRLHVRTELFGEFFSVISNAALRIGSDVLEITKDGSHYINGVSNVEMPFKLAGQFSVKKTVNTESAGFDPLVSHGFTKEELKNSTLFTVDLLNEEYIEIQAWKDMLWVNAHGTDMTFHDSIGLMGSWGKAGKIGRDGVTNFDDAADFAQEWQVVDIEPMLFREIKDPQHPSPCRLPSSVVPNRRLGEEQRARKACAEVKGPQYKSCIFDVIATGDVEMAYMYLSK